MFLNIGWADYHALSFKTDSFNKHSLSRRYCSVDKWLLGAQRMPRVIKGSGYIAVDQTDACSLVDKVDFEQVIASECENRLCWGAFPMIIQISFSHCPDISPPRLCLQVLPLLSLVYGRWLRNYLITLQLILHEFLGI